MTCNRHPDLPDVDDPDTVHWRYMDLCGLLDLLQTAELHLARADQMEDRWEGYFGDYNRAMRPAVYGEQWSSLASAFQMM